MKNLLLALVLVPSFAHAAAPYETARACDGVELVANDAGKRGTIELEVSMDGKYVNSPWILTARWAGGATLVAAGEINGVKLDVDCRSPGKTLENNGLEVFTMCGIGAFDTRGLPHHAADAHLVLSGDHGRLNTAAHDAGVISTIELSNCR